MALVSRLCPVPGPARPEETSVQPARGPGVPERVLIIDPSVEHRVFVASLLESAGCPVIAVSRPDELLGQFDANPSVMAGVDLVIVDVADDARVAAVKKIAADERLRDIPVIAMVRTPAPAALGEALSPGLGAIVRKPVTPGDLLVSLRTCMRLRWEITRRKELERELAEAQAVLNAVSCRLAEVVVLDPVTGLPNRRRMEEVLGAEWRRGLRIGTPLSLVMVDVDSFKIVNDTHGHQAGDECLRLVAATLVDVAGRTGDLVARYGGDEFVVMLPETPLEGALVVAEAARSRVEVLGIPGASSVDERVTISVGAAAMIPAADSSPATLISRADQALYCAKREGRNRVRVSGECNRTQEPAVLPRCLD